MFQTAQRLLPPNPVKQILLEKQLNPNRSECGAAHTLTLTQDPRDTARRRNDPLGRE